MSATASIDTTAIKERLAVANQNPEVLSQVYQDKVNIAIWQRTLPESLTSAAEKILTSNPRLQAAFSTSPGKAYQSISDTLGTTQEAELLSRDIVKLIEMFSDLFDLKNVGLRLTSLSRAMCPRFHVDRVPCRLVTTYTGVATEWLPHAVIDRSKLGTGNNGKPDEESGLMNSSDDIKQLDCGEVALIKGESWEGNEGAGLVHRSPQVMASQNRLLLTLDFAD